MAVVIPVCEGPLILPCENSLPFACDNTAIQQSVCLFTLAKKLLTCLNVSRLKENNVNG
jgi:hypothetical protein